jgi:Domain of unknown function (DUF3883)/Family of unknown function (DUF6416)
MGLVRDEGGFHVILGDTDPLWDTASGGDGHREPAWTAADGPLAVAFWAATDERARAFLGLLIDRPGQLLDSDWIAGQAPDPDGARDRTGRRRRVSNSIEGMSAAQAASGRQYPFKWFAGRNGSPSQYGMKHYVAALFREARDPVSVLGAEDDWNAVEVAAIVDDYLAMLAAEAVGERFSKKAHREALIGKLTPRRTMSAIEWKHRNISSAMVDLGLPYIRGYLPGDNRQAALTAEIQRRIDGEPGMVAVLWPAEAEFAGVHQQLLQTAPPEAGRRAPRGRHVDYGALQEESMRVGRRGEELVVEYERDRLRRAGRPDLADAVRWVAVEDGDGAGYDVLSFDAGSGSDLFIEVKTTAYTAEMPFYISGAELRFARHHPESYALYRVSNVHDKPEFFALHGDISAEVRTEPISYRAWLHHDHADREH